MRVLLALHIIIKKYTQIRKKIDNQIVRYIIEISPLFILTTFLSRENRKMRNF